MKKSLSKVTSEGGLSLLQYLKQRTGLSGKEVKRAIDAKRCLVNGVVERFSTYRVQRGDLIEFSEREFEALKLLYQDEQLDAWYKPPFYVVSNKRFFLHRLDKETSGVLLNSKEEAFLDLFRHREIEKTYFAICEGRIAERSGVIKDPIEGKEAETAWESLSVKGELTLVKCKPKTGRTHQIRIHLNSIGLGILGDHVYAGRQGSVQRMFLHAYEVRFVHPMTGEKKVIRADIPKEFLERFGAHLYR